jgi:dynein heavy chain
VKDRPAALVTGTTPGWFEVFQKSNLTLEEIQKNLEDYLETKRMAVRYTQRVECRGQNSES